MIQNNLPQALIGLLCLSISHFLFAQAGSQTLESLDSSSNGTTYLQPVLDSGAGGVYPAGIIALPDDTRYLIWTEFNEGKLHLIERLADQSFRVLKSIPISIGKQGYGKEVEGDKKTPVGVYRVTSYIPEDELTDFYGLGAYPVNYPNNWDRLQKRTGYGIWLHGLPKGVDQRPLLDSDGCVVVDNQSLTYLDDYIVPGETLVVLANQLEWEISGQSSASNSSGTEAVNTQSPDIVEAIESWQKSWESLDAEAYLNHYHADFSDFEKDLQAWKEYKTAINQRKSFINVSLSKLSAIRYPGTESLVSVRFYQDYESSNYDWAGWKELLWKKDSKGQWKIVFEGNG